MSGSQTHPRRRPLKPTDSQAPQLSTHGMQLRKSGTFSSPHSVSSDICDLDNHHFMPRRSPTSTDSLEQLLQDNASVQRVQRVTNLLKDFDKKLAGHKASSASILNDREVYPVPSFLLDNTSMGGTPMDIDPKPLVLEQNPHEHASDSGLGCSISGSKNGDARSTFSSTSTHSAITGSLSALGASEEKRPLSDFASKQIHDHIIKPILAEESLKEFHQLINDVPRRIGNKNICNLRDLEKTLVFLAPEYSATPASYHRFCERSITLLQATFGRLAPLDQRLPTDRPYTTNYFLDLLEQIRRYADIMARTRQKLANGDKLDDMDYSRDEKMALRGGLSHNGRPLELVREKNGKVIPLAEGADAIDTGFPSSKRALPDDEMDDEDVSRSMARRRKSEKPGDVVHSCSSCNKIFKRPCDLTKHEKTHSRPWKCQDESCKYHELGWPTEKECQRHWNDKHSVAPPQYKCGVGDCTYASKRESNCKQHREKAHQIQYIRSKSNGKKKAPAASDNERAPPTPLTPFLETPISAMATPATPWLMSPSMPLVNGFDMSGGYPNGFGTPAMTQWDLQDEVRRDSVTTTEGSILTYSSGYSEHEPMSFENAVTPEEPLFNHNDFLNCGGNGDLNSGFQQLTPAMSTGYENYDSLSMPMDCAMTGTLPYLSPGVPHLSPGAQPGVTLYSPHLPMDEGFIEPMSEPMSSTFNPGMADFTLFDAVQANNMHLNPTDNFFHDIDANTNATGGQFESTFYTNSHNDNYFNMQ